MNRIIRTLAFLLGTALFVAPALADEGERWEPVDESDGVRVWVREVPRSSIREVKAEAVVNLPAERLWRVLKAVESYDEFMPYVVEAKIVGRSEPNVVYEYQLLDPPLVDKRDYTLKVEIHEDAKKGVFRRTWSAVADKGPKPREDVVRITTCNGTWTVKRLGEQSTLLTYWLYTDPGGSIPSWIANKANTTSVTDLMKAVRQRAQDPSWSGD